MPSAGHHRSSWVSVIVKTVWDRDRKSFRTKVFQHRLKMSFSIGHILSFSEPPSTDDRQRRKYTSPSCIRNGTLITLHSHTLPLPFCRPVDKNGVNAPVFALFSPGVFHPEHHQPQLLLRCAGCLRRHLPRRAGALPLPAAQRSSGVVRSPR